MTVPSLAPVRDDAGRWHGSLKLRFVRDGAGTRLAERVHHGPLRVQKALHPEGAAVCQVVVLHPPAGIAGGDALEIDVDVGAGAHAQIITPGATRWYRTSGLDARQDFTARVAPGGTLEWLPHEAIVFDGARARMHTRLLLGKNARAIVCDIVGLGRVASGESFASGRLHQRFEVVRDDALVWAEQNVLDATDRLRSAAVGLAGRAAFGMLLVAAPEIAPAWIAAARAAGSDLANSDSAVTHVPGVLMMRCRAASPPAAVDWLRSVWGALRPLVLDRAAVPPRLWST